MNSILLLIMILIGPAVAGEHRVKLDNGQEAILRDDMTWDYAEPVSGSSVTVKAKYAEEAVEIWDKSLLIKDTDYKKVVALQLHPWNKTDKKVIGLTVYVRVINPFGKVVMERTFNDEGVIEPLERKKDETFWNFEDNQFTDGEPYDLMWQMAQAGTAKIEVAVRKVVFGDGTVLERKSAMKSKKQTH